MVFFFQKVHMYQENFLKKINIANFDSFVSYLTSIEGMVNINLQWSFLLH